MPGTSTSPQALLSDISCKLPASLALNYPLKSSGNCDETPPARPELHLLTTRVITLSPHKRSYMIKHDEDKAIPVVRLRPENQRKCAELAAHRWPKSPIAGFDSLHTTTIRNKVTHLHCNTRP
ncbi:hypothetical protein EVAR_71728_1 [Eumeta japonica]|uniref:Uncharacterized protein n=1 Tax=Eumeta variegata TaxID=151549 RepID=A0A4C1SXW0_EUMVA|nr:hypothetical protein EVAR_71728_1 [Eumeta japonica]